MRVPLKAGLRQVTVTAVKSDAVKPEGLGPARIPIWGHDYDGDIRAPLVFSVLLIGGPYNGEVPQDSPSRRRIFACYPKSAKSAVVPALTAVDVAEETSCATKILSTLARRAYRRPATKDDVQTLLGFYKTGRAEGDFETGIRAALERLLVSPDFLFRIESDPQNTKPGTAYRLSDVDLASRLSFFLWSSIPDDALLDLAIRRKLRDPKVFEQQVRRMLADPRARRALVDNFFSQWLQVRNVWLLTPDANRKYPWFDDNLRTAFVKETELFLESQLQEDRSAVDLLTADYTFLNEQLARHYGISDVYGSHFRRVTLTDPNRWGLLGKASILAVTSYPHRTSPTIRGKWLLENILVCARAASTSDGQYHAGGGEDREDHVGPRDAGAAPQRIPRAQAVTRVWIRWVSASRISMRSGSGARRTARRPSTPPACCWTARKSMAPWRSGARWSHRKSSS